MVFTMTIDVTADPATSYRQLLDRIDEVRLLIKGSAILAGSVNGPVVAGDGGGNGKASRWYVSER